MMDLSAEAIREIQTTAVNAQRPQILSGATPEPSHLYYLLNPDGSYSLKTVLPRHRNDTVGSLEAIIALAKSAEADADAHPCIWYSSSKILLYFNQDDRANEATLPLACTETAKLIMGDKPTISEPRDQKAFETLLRIGLHKPLLSDNSLLAVVRHITWGRRAEGEATVQHGKESMERSADSEIRNASSIPRLITLKFRLFSVLDLDYKVSIPCAVELSLKEDVTFALIPLTDTREDETTRVVEALGNEIRSKVSCPVVYGEPSTKA